MDRKKREEEARRERNARLTDLVKAGEPIPPLVPPEATFFPPRRVIEKDEGAIERIFGEGADSGEAEDAAKRSRPKLRAVADPPA